MELAHAYCSICKQKLDVNEDFERILIVCINSCCPNYWNNEGSEIIIKLK